eukprot:6604797-Alexandrium_andersonii.AAC.1
MARSFVTQHSGLQCPCGRWCARSVTTFRCPSCDSRACTQCRGTDKQVVPARGEHHREQPPLPQMEEGA